MTDSSPRLIKKYANRRLYDTVASRHVTLEDIHKLIIEGHQVSVIDDKTGDDLTRSVLLQIVADREHMGRPILSSQLLHSIVRFYGTAMEEFTGQYLEKSVEKLLEQQSAMREQAWNFMSTAPMATMMEAARKNVEMWSKFQEQVFPATDKKPTGE